VNERKGVAVGLVVLGTIKIVGAVGLLRRSLGLLPVGTRVDHVVTGRTRSFDPGVFEYGATRDAGRCHRARSYADMSQEVYRAPIARR
jgi:hypothetical protein